MSLSSYHFDLSYLKEEEENLTFHKRGKVYKIKQHTYATRKAAMGLLMLSANAFENITHYVDGVETDPDEGVLIQAVKKTVMVDGPNGPKTQSYDQIISYSISIPGSGSPILRTEDLAYALMFMHNNLMSLEKSDNFSIPKFIFENCIKPNAGDLIQQLNELPISGGSWISDPYAVMVGPEGDKKHLVYPDSSDLLNKLNELVNAGACYKSSKPFPAIKASPKAGEWVYSQRLNSDDLQPALSSCLAAALRVSKNAEEMKDVSWSTQSAVLSSTYQAKQASNSLNETFVKEELTDAGDVRWTLNNLTPGSGLTVDASSLVVDMNKDNDSKYPNYQGQMSFNCTNHWLRHLSGYVQFLKYEGTGANAKLVPINLGNSQTKVPNPNCPADPDAPQNFYLNTTWPGDFVNYKLGEGYPFSYVGFIEEPDDTEKFLGWVNPTGTICGIPVPAAATSMVIDYIPKEANVVRVIWGGMGRGPYDQQACAIGITLTAVFELALPMILLMYDAATVDSAALTESVWNHKGTMFNLLKTVVGVVMNTKLDADTMVQQDAEAIGKFLAESLLPDLLQTGCAYGIILMAQIGVGAVMEAIPFVDIASLIFNGIVTAAQLSQTICEVVQSPFVFQTDIARTFDVTLTIKPDADMHEFPPEAIGGTYRVSIAYSNNSTPAVVEYQMPTTTHSTPIVLNFSNLPAGAQIQVSVFMYSTTGWQAGQGQSDWLDAAGDGKAPNKFNKNIEVTVKNNLPPLDKFSIYEFIEKTVYENGGRAWRGVKSIPAATQPVAVEETDTNITELNGLTISQSAGMLGYTYQTNATEFTVENISLLENPQTAYAAAKNITIMPALAYQRIGAFDGSGLNFYLDTNPASNPDKEAHLRRLSLVWTEKTQSQPPNMNPDPGMSWGRFPFPMDRLAAFNDYVAGIAYDTINHSKIYVVRLPKEAMAINKAPKAYMISGPGTRVGLISLPRAITFGMQGQVLILEGGATARIQAFDVNGNSYNCFDPADTGTKQSIAPLANVTERTVLLDLAVEPKGYMYVLSYEDLGSSPSDYHLDLYLPNGAWLARTDNFAAANIAVDVIRDVYTLNYEVLENSPTLEPSVSLWIPPVKSYQGTVISISNTTIEMQDKQKKVLFVATNTDTLFMINGKVGAFANIKMADTITAFGCMGSNGVLTATQIFDPATT